MLLAMSKTMREADRFAIEKLGIPSTLLMRKAAKALADSALCFLKDSVCPRAAVFCGSGNNGGDGIGAAAELIRQGVLVRVFLVSPREKMTEDSLEMERRLIEMGGGLEVFSRLTDIGEYCASCGVIIDAMFGTGLSSPLKGDASSAARLINSLDVPVVAADIASGVAADTGLVPGIAVRADITVTFGQAKPGHFVEPGCVYTGQLKVADIGTEVTDRDGIFSVGLEDIKLPERDRLSHKGTFGRVLIIGGSVGYTGAPVLSARAAQRAGAGLVFVGVPEKIYPIAAKKLDEPMPFPLPCDKDGKLQLSALDEIKKKLGGISALLLGPGLGRSEDLKELVCGLIKDSGVPAVIDADGLNALAENINILDGQVKKPLVLTPHEGEFARLGGDLSEGRLFAARGFAKKHGCVLVLKGHRTISAFPDGEVYINTTGNPGMAKGGSGDVLAGIIVALLAQGLKTKEAVKAAVYIHSAAGDMLAGKLSEYSLLPSDIIRALPKVIMKLT